MSVLASLTSQVERVPLHNVKTLEDICKKLHYITLALCAASPTNQNTFIRGTRLYFVKLSPSNLIKATRFFVILSDTSMNARVRAQVMHLLHVSRECHLHRESGIARTEPHGHLVSAQPHEGHSYVPS
jgi:hypothetical protein